jgi:hypothetical protein
LRSLRARPWPMVRFLFLFYLVCTDTCKFLAAKRAGVGLFIWSTVPSATERTGGKLIGPPLIENKAEIDRYLKEIGIPHISLHLAFFLEYVLFAEYVYGL